jgi:peptidoglycan/xylan/chitin deacetylase (PgdA/CDA1 family)
MQQPARFVQVILFCVAIYFSTAVHAVEMAVTIDDLPTTGSMPKGMDRAAIAKSIVAILQKHHVVRPYGFVNAKQFDEVPEHESIVRDWVAAGFPIGNHTFSHANLESISADVFISDIKKNEPALRRLSKGANFKMFRYPYLHEAKAIDKHKAVRQALMRDGYQVAPVTTYFDDWAWNEAYVRCADKNNSAEIENLKRSYLKSAQAQFEWVRQISAKLESRQTQQILLLHINAFNAVMLESLFKQYETAGVAYVSLEHALQDPIFKRDPPVPSDSEISFWQRIAISQSAVELPPHPEFPLKELDQVCR